MKDNPFIVGAQRASVNLPELEKARYSPNPLTNALGNLVVSAVDETVTQRYKASYEEGKEQVLFDDNSFESIIKESKEKPWYLKAFGLGGKLYGAREAQYTKSLVRLRSQLEESMPENAGLSAKDYDKYIVSTMSEFMTEDDQFNEQFKKKAIQERLDLINKQQQLHATYRIKEATKSAVELYGESSRVSSEPLREEALLDITKILNSPASSQVIESLDSIIKTQVISGDSSMIDGLIARQMDSGVREELIKLKDNALDIKYQRGTERYENQVTDSYNELKIAVSDPRIDYKTFRSQLEYQVTSLGLDSDDYKRFMALKVGKNKEVAKLIASRASEGRSLAQREADSEELLLLKKRFDMDVINKGQALDKLKVMLQRGQLSESKYLSEVNKVKSKEIDTEVLKARDVVRSELDKLTSYEDGINLINSSNLTPRGKKALIEEWELKQTNEGKEYLKVIESNLEKITPDVLKTYAESPELNNPTRQAFNKLLQDKFRTEAQVADVLTNVSLRSPMNDDVEKAIQYQVETGNLPLQSRLAGIHKTEAPSSVKDSIKFITSTIESAESINDYAEQASDIELMIEYQKRYGTPATINRFGLNVDGQRLLNAIESKYYDVTAGLYAYRTGSLIDSPVSPKMAKEVAVKSSKDTDNPMTGVLVTEFLDSFTQANPTATDKEVNNAVDAFIESNNTAGVIGLNKTNLYGSPLGFVSDISELASDFYKQVIDDDYVVDNFDVKVSYEPSSDRFLMMRINKDTGENTIFPISKNLLEGYYKTTSDYDEAIGQQREYEQELKEAHLKAMGDRAL